MSKVGLKYIDINKDLKVWRNKVEWSMKKGANKKYYTEAAKYVSTEMSNYIKKKQYAVGATMKNGNKRPEVVYRYKKKGMISGGDDPVAAYKYGNLSRSIKTLTHLKRSNILWVGPDTRGGRLKAGGYVYYNSKRKVDPYYAHMVNNGTSKQQGMFFLERTAEKVRSTVNMMLGRKARKMIGYWLSRNGLR